MLPKPRTASHLPATVPAKSEELRAAHVLPEAMICCAACHWPHIRILGPHMFSPEAKTLCASEQHQPRLLVARGCAVGHTIPVPGVLLVRVPKSPKCRVPVLRSYELTEVSATLIEVVPNLPKCRVQVLKSYGTYQVSGTGIEFVPDVSKRRVPLSSSYRTLPKTSVLVEYLPSKNFTPGILWHVPYRTQTPLFFRSQTFGTPTCMPVFCTHDFRIHPARAWHTAPPRPEPSKLDWKYCLAAGRAHLAP